jgi:hypothetical protein
MNRTKRLLIGLSAIALTSIFINGLQIALVKDMADRHQRVTEIMMARIRHERETLVDERG